MKKEIQKIIAEALKMMQEEKILSAFDFKEIRVDLNSRLQFGHYSSNIAFVLSKRLNKSVDEIASIIIKNIEGLDEGQYFEKIEVKNGFLNFFLSSKILFKNFRKILKQKTNYGSRPINNKKVAVFDYSSPNIAKPFGIGHLRSTIVGYSLYTLYKFLGWHAVGDNHLGDWGTQFGKLIYQLKTKVLVDKTPKEQKQILSQITIQDLEKLYIDFHREAEQNPLLEEEGRKWFAALEQGDKEARRLWKFCVQVSMKEFDRIYGLLGVKFDYVLSESFYENKLKNVLKELQVKKLVTPSEGALIFDFSPLSLPPALVLKSDSATTYFLRDLTALKYRLDHFKPKLIVYEVGMDQKLYFEQLFEAAQRLGWLNGVKLVHVAHGLVRWPEGKFSTRKGLTIHLEEVLEEAQKKALTIIKASATGRGFSLKQQKLVAQKVGIGAIKYNFLSYHYASDIIFDWERILNLDGNSGPYLQYTLARCFSILDKGAKIKQDKRYSVNLSNDKFLIHPLELTLLSLFVKFEDILEEASEQFAPHLICNFAFQLAEEYNRFYQELPILKAATPEAQGFRLQLTMATNYLLQICFSLLGLEVLKKM